MDSYFHGFGEEPLNPQESIHEKIHLVTTHLQEWIFKLNFWIILKLTFLFQLFSKFRENVIWPIKAKSMISAKIFFRETLEGFYIEIDNKAYFWRRHNRFRKNYYLIGNNFVGQNFRHAKFFIRDNFHHLAKISSLFYNKNCYLYMKKGDIWKQATLITKPHEFSRILDYIKYLMVASNNWRKIHTVILRKYYVHVTMQILCH